MILKKKSHDAIRIKAVINVLIVTHKSFIHGLKTIASVLYRIK